MAGDDQRTKGIVLHAMHRAVHALYGEAGLGEVAAFVSADTRAATIERTASPLEWYPERFLCEWHEAAWHGPAKRDDASLCRLVDKRVDLGFSRVRKALLGLVGPEGVMRRAGELWRHDHTHGTLSVSCDAAAKTATGTLTDHVYCQIPIARLAATETFRYIVTLSRGVKAARATHGMQGKALTMRLSWE
jgi:hypothetical protein